jgi:tripartite-type tricarboxylate transporter receptor subunit TctC
MAGSGPTRRTVLAALANAPLASAVRAQAQTTWPNRPVRVMVPYPPAGGADTTARIIYAKLSEELGQQFAIENRGGAGGTIGEAAVAKAAPDGYSILHDATGFSVNGALYHDLPFDYRKDFDPVFLVSLVPNILVVAPSVPVKTVADVIALAKASPDGIAMASSGNGTLQHLCLELFKQRTGLKITHVPYRGGGPALIGLLGGEVQVFFSALTQMLPYVRDGRLRGLAVTSAARNPLAPEIPTMEQSGFDQFVTASVNFIVAPPGTPMAVRRRLSDAVARALDSDQVKTAFAKIGAKEVPATPEQLATYIAQQQLRWSKIVAATRISVE